MTNVNKTSAAVSGLNLTLEPLESLIFKGLQQKIQNLLQAKVAWASSTDKMLVLQELFGSPSAGTNDLSITYPYVFLTLASYQEADARLHNRRAAMRGLPAVIVDDNKRAYNVKFLAVDFNVTFQYVTNSFKQAQKVAGFWLFARKNGWLKFDVQYGRTHFGIGFDLDSSISLPQREADLEDVSEYTLEANLVVNGFISFPTLMEQQVADKLLFEQSLPEGTVVWSFQTQSPDTTPVDPIVPPNQR